MAYLYRHIRLDKNEPFYIGISSDKNYSRASDLRKRNRIWKSIYNKTQIQVQVLLDNLTWSEACIKEQEFIQLYGRICMHDGILANMSLGGEGYLDPSLEVRKKLSEAKKGKNNPFFEKEFSEEHKANLRKSRKGKAPIKAKQILNTKTGEVYKDIHVVSNLLGISINALYKRMRRQHNWYLKFI